MQLDVAAQHLRNGKLVAFPTETVYGLGANARDDKAVAEIYAAKGRPQFNPLIVHVEDARAIADDVKWSDTAQKLSAAFWPGALTLVLPRKPGARISLLASAGLDTIAVRSPAHPVARSLLREAGIPIAAPSANRSGRVSPTTAAHVREEFGDAIFILDGGACPIGVESTVLDLTGTPTILRPGSVTKEQLEAILQTPLAYAAANAAIAAPGMLASHYAPSIPVRLNAHEARAGEALLAFGNANGAMNLSPSGNLTEAAANLFAMLRALDKKEYVGIAVMPIPEKGLGVAINDRLKRAAS